MNGASKSAMRTGEAMNPRTDSRSRSPVAAGPVGLSARPAERPSIAWNTRASSRAWNRAPIRALTRPRA